MKVVKRIFISIAVLIAGLLIFSSFHNKRQAYIVPVFPYKAAGLTKRQAAAHLLNRFTFGATPGRCE